MDPEVMRSFDRAVIVRWNFLEAQILVKCTRTFHLVECVKQHAGIASLPRAVEYRFGQLPTEPLAPEARSHIKSFHFAGIGIINSVEWTQSTAARQLVVDQGQQQGASGRRVLPRQLGQLSLETLKTQVNLKTRSVLEKYAT